ncbi:MAG: PaaX family transcriptional regulator C-terminal domain-containing protein [Rhodoglobus sp.]
MNFGSSYPEWDGLWTLVSFSVPTNSRSVLQSLRSRLRRLGLGCLRDGVWLSPHDLVKESLEALEGSALDTAHVFRGTHFARAGEVSLSDVFDTAPLRALYDDFIDRYHDISLDMTPAEALTTRTMLLFDWLSIRRRDPDLPVELLPTDWPRPRAFAIFRQLHQRLGRASEERFREVVAQYSPELAALSLAPDAGLPVPADPAGLRPGLT